MSEISEIPKNDVSQPKLGTIKQPNDTPYELIKMLYWFHQKYPTWFKVHKVLETKINNELP